MEVSDAEYLTDKEKEVFARFGEGGGDMNDVM